MNLPILTKLKEGVKFDFETLADNVEKTDLFWDWWWEEKSQSSKIIRPETIEDSDQILIETVHKSFVDTICHRNAMDDPLFRLLNEGVIPSAASLDRDLFRNLTMKAVAVATEALREPQIVFAGGGYGSGKTTVLGDLAECGTIPVRGMVGVDMFKQLIPEFHLIKSVADGRASLTVQKECLRLTKSLFPLLIEKKRSFILDSSMSDHKETSMRIQLARKAGYRLILVAVLTPLEVAIRLAMGRAKISRRFPHLGALPESHVLFRQHIMKYIPLFDIVLIFANSGIDGKVHRLAEKKFGKELEIFDAELFTSASRME